MMNKLNNITLFATECPKCGHKNPQKKVHYKENMSKNEREELVKETMRCEECGYDIYTHKMKEFM